MKGDEPEALEILADVLKNPVFPEDEIKKEKEKIYAAIKAQKDDVYSAGFLKMRETLFGDYPYALRVIGEADSVMRITGKDLKNFYGKFGTARNMVIAAVGDFDSSHFAREIEKHFSGMNQNALAFGAPAPPPLKGDKSVNIDMPREQTLIIWGHMGVSLKNPQRYPLDVLISVLSGENGRLYQSVRNKLGLSYAQGAFQVPGVDTGFIASYIATDESRLDEARKALRDELEKIRRGAMQDEEISLGKTSLIGNRAISLQAYGALAYQMALDEIYDIGYNAYQDYPGIISRITKEDVISVAKRYIDFKNSVNVIVKGKR